MFPILRKHNFCQNFPENIPAAAIVNPNPPNIEEVKLM
jgi:hypothetical protein